MASAPYKFTDRRGTQNTWGANNMIGAARRNLDREVVLRHDKDFHRNVSTFGRLLLTSMGRKMFWNIPALQGAALEQADLAVGTFIPQFYGANKAFGDKAEEWLTQWHKIFDISGWPYDYETYVRALNLCPMVDGDIGTLLTETPDGYPLIQTIPAHRIGSQISTETTVLGGEYDGCKITDGVIHDDYLRALAYRVFEDATSPDPTAYRDISTRDMFLTFDPMFPGQLRGLSGFASSAFNFEDAAEYDRFEMLAQKGFASTILIETNETGDTDPAKAVISTQATFDENNNKTAPDQQMLTGGMYRYFRAGTGSKLEAFHYDRPTTAAQEYQDRKIRDAFRGIQWDSFFSLDPKAVGGAPMRIIVEKLNRVLDKRRKMTGKAVVRVDGYGLSKAIKLKELPFDVDWWKIEHQGPGDITADRKYDSDVDIQEIHSRISTRKRACGKRGEYWEETDAQTELEADSDIAAANRLAKKHGIAFQEALMVLRPPGTSSQMPQPQQPPEASAPKGKTDAAPQASAPSFAPVINMPPISIDLKDANTRATKPEKKAKQNVAINRNKDGEITGYTITEAP